MGYYIVQVKDGPVLYELKVYAEKFRADSEGNVVFYTRNDDPVRAFKASDIVVDSIKKVKMEENSG